MIQRLFYWTKNSRLNRVLEPEAMDTAVRRSITSRSTIGTVVPNHGPGRRPGKPHSLRHWFGSTLKEAGVDSLVIKELMGHESLATTAIYVQVPLKMQCSAVNLLPTFH
jgi:site-specific recombinase XerD